MSSPPALPIPPNIASITTPLLLGEIFSSYLFGVLTVQVYIYYLTFPKDSTYIKAFVYTVFALEIASSIMTIFDFYHWFAVGFGSVPGLNNIQLSAVDTPMLGAFVAAAVQMFYCYRIYTINKKAWPVSIIVALLALAEIVGGLYGAVVGEQVKTFSSAKSKTIVSIYILFVGAAVADIVIATTMITLLMFTQQSRVSVSVSNQRSTSTVRKIINLIVETNLASASIALLTLILLVAIPGTNYFTCPSYVLGKIYSNSLLLILNNRHYLTTNVAQGGSQPSNGALKMSKLRDTDFSSSSGNSQSRDPLRIEIETATATETLQSSYHDAKKVGITY